MTSLVYHRHDARKFLFIYFCITSISQQEKAGVVLGRSIGPFVLGQTLQTAVDVIRHHLPKHRAEVCYHEGEPSRHLLLLKACEQDGASGLYVLRFDPTLQLLVTVSYFPPLRVRLAITTSAGGEPSLPFTIGDLIDIFGQPARWEATTLAGRKEAVRCFYEGTCFVFRCLHGNGSREFRLDEGTVASKSELITLHVTTHVGAPTYCLWGGHVSLSKLLPTHFGLFESRLVVEAATRWARGIEMSAKSGEIIQVLFGATSQDVLRALGCPDSVWYKEDHHVSVDGLLIQRAGTAGVYFSYRRLGVSLLIDASTHQVKKIVLHTNVPGYFEFCSYSRCYFKASLTSDGLATNDDDSFLLMPETKWSTFVRNVDTACIRHLGRCLYEPSTNSCYPFPPTNMWVLFDQFLVETTSHDDIAKVTIVAPDSTTVTTRQSVVTRTSPGNLLPVREEVVSSGHLTGRVSGVQQLGQVDCAAIGHDPTSNNWRRSSEAHSNEAHSNEGCSNDRHSNEAHSSEGHSNEGHSNEGHIGVGGMEVFSTLGNDDDNELFCSAESSLEALQLSPTSPATIQLSPTSPATIQLSPTSPATIQLSPASPATIQLSPTSPATIQLSPTSPATIQLSPASPATIQLSPASPATIQLSPTSPATIQLSPASPATIQLSPASPTTIQSPPSQEQLYISHFCPSLNTLLTEVQGAEGVKEGVQRAEGVKEGVQRADGVKEGVPYYNCMVYDFHDGPRVGVANNGTPRDALPSLAISLSNMDSIQWGKSGSKEVDGNDDASKTLQNEHTVGVEDLARDDMPSAISPEDSLFEIVSHKELIASSPIIGTVADALLAGPDNHTLSDGHIPVEGHAPSEVHIPMEEHAGHAPSDDHSTNEQPEARSTKFKTPPPKQEDHPQILYRPSISTATPSRLLSLSQDLGMVAWARERGGQAGTTETSTRAPPSSSHASAQSEKVWKRLLGHTQSSERRVRQKYQPGTKKQEKAGLESADGQVCEDIGTENSCDPCLEEGGGDGMEQVSEARRRGSDGDHGDMSRLHSGSGDQVVACAPSEHQTATDDLGCLRTNSAPLASQPEAVLEGGEPCTQGKCCLQHCPSWLVIGDGDVIEW